MNTAIFQYLHSFSGQSVYFDLIIIFGAKYLPYLMVAVLGLFADRANTDTATVRTDDGSISKRQARHRFSQPLNID